MKYLSIMFLILLLSGCTHTRNITEYSSKEEYFKEIIKEADNSDVAIIMDSSYIPINAQQINFNNDSLYGILLLESSLEKKFVFDTDQLKNISFRKQWSIMIKGMLVGTLFGGMLGMAALNISTEGNYNTYVHHELEFILGSITGLIIGGVLGAIIGEKYIFLFNQ